MPRHARGRHFLVRDQAPVDRNDIVRAVPAQAGDASPVDSERDHGAPAEASLVARDCINRDVDVETSDPAELLADHRSLQPPLGIQAGVLPVAAAATARPRVGAWRHDPVGGGLLDLDGVGPGKAGGRLRHGGANALAGQGVPDENDDARIILPGHAPAAVHDLADGEFDHVTDLRSGGGHASHEHNRAPAVVPRSGPGAGGTTGLPAVGIVTAASSLEGSSCIS
jgi:hypothetical protein